MDDDDEEIELINFGSPRTQRVTGPDDSRGTTQLPAHPSIQLRSSHERGHQVPPLLHERGHQVPSLLPIDVLGPTAQPKPTKPSWTFGNRRNLFHLPRLAMANSDLTRSLTQETRLDSNITGEWSHSDSLQTSGRSNAKFLKSFSSKPKRRSYESRTLNFGPVQRKYDVSEKLSEYEMTTHSEGFLRKTKEMYSAGSVEKEIKKEATEGSRHTRLDLEHEMIPSHDDQTLDDVVPQISSVRENGDDAADGNDSDEDDETNQNTPLIRPESQGCIKNTASDKFSASIYSDFVKKERKNVVLSYIEEHFLPKMEKEGLQKLVKWNYASSEEQSHTITTDDEEVENINFSNKTKRSKRKKNPEPRIDPFQDTYQLVSDLNQSRTSRTIGSQSRDRKHGSWNRKGTSGSGNPGSRSRRNKNVNKDDRDVSSEDDTKEDEEDTEKDTSRETSATTETSEDSPKDEEPKESTEGSEEAETSAEATSNENSPSETSEGSPDKSDSPESKSDKRSSSSSSNEDEKNKKKKKKRQGFFNRLCKSKPEEYILLKTVVWFPIGAVVALLLYYLIIQKMDMEEENKAPLGAAVGLFVAVLFAFSAQMRCVVTLVVPSFVGKAGRSYFAAFALVYLINGPITNIMDNCNEIVRSLTCNTALAANHTRALWRLRLSPVEAVLGDIMTDNYLVKRASKMIRKTFSPMRQEIEDKEEVETKRTVKKSHQRKRTRTEQEKKDAGKKVEKDYEKKMNHRCEGTFENGVGRCKIKLGKLFDRCIDKLWLLGYLLCWPLKITAMCNLVKILPKFIGMECNSQEFVSPGFGDTYMSARGTMDDMDEGAEVNMQYKVVGNADADYMPVEEMRQSTIREVQEKTQTIKIGLTMIKFFLTFTFLLVFRGAYKYNRKYLTDFTWDNKYITAYFRHIDARRKAQGKRTLLPLKKTEKKTYIDVKTLKVSGSEKKVLTKGAATLIMRVLVAAIICYMDSVFYQILDIIARNSRIEYHQTGHHIVELKVYGRGFMSNIVRTLLSRFSHRKKLDQLTTNYECLPRPTETDPVLIASIFGTYILVYIFLYFQTLGLRLRRVIASFFFRKREKKRVLYLYNEMYRKRIGFLRHMRKKVKKQLRNRELKNKVGLMLALRRTCPGYCNWLQRFKSGKDYCIICSEPENKTFYTCPREGCRVGYCRECWIDISKKSASCPVWTLMQTKPTHTRSLWSDPLLGFSFILYCLMTVPMKTEVSFLVT